MGFGFRKSVSFGKGLKMNVSKSGVGFSAGGKGLRMSTSSRGTRLSAGTGGFYYNAKIGGSSKRKKADKELTAFDVFLGSALLFALSTFLKIKGFVLFGMISYLMICSFIVGSISFIMFYSSKKKKKASNFASDYNFNEDLTLEDEILIKIKNSGETGVLQTDLTNFYYKDNPSKSTIYKAVQALEAQYRITKEKEGRTYRIFFLS